MRTIYIKFKHPDDIYAINPFYQSPLPLGESEHPKICSRCGDTLYIPVEFPEEMSIVQPMGDIFRPLPIENPHIISRGEPELITLSFSKKFDYLNDWNEMQRLRTFPGMAYVGEDGFEMYIDGVSEIPVPHKCSDLKKI